MLSRVEREKKFYNLGTSSPFLSEKIALLKNDTKYCITKKDQMQKKQKQQQWEQ